MRAGKLLLQKEIVVTKPQPATTGIAELEKKSYAYFDAITVAILDDPDFRKELLTPQEKPI